MKGDVRSEEPIKRKLPRGAVKICFVLLPQADGSLVVDGKSVRFRPLIDHSTAEKCLYAIEHWSKIVARGMRLDGAVAPKVREAFENVGAQVVETAAGALFEKFFGRGRSQ